VIAWIQSSGSRIRSGWPVRGVRGRAHAHLAARDLLDRVEGGRTAGQVARQALGPVLILGRHALLAVRGKARTDPTQKRPEELLRQPLGPVQAPEQPPAEDLLHQARVKVGQLEKLPLLELLDVPLEGLLEELVEGGALGMPWPVGAGAFGAAHAPGGAKGSTGHEPGGSSSS